MVKPYFEIVKFLARHCGDYSKDKAVMYNKTKQNILLITIMDLINTNCLDSHYYSVT